MNVLVDTHTLLWALTDESKLSERARKLLPRAETWFSVASPWEILIKAQAGKMSLPRQPGPFSCQSWRLMESGSCQSRQTMFCGWNHCPITTGIHSTGC